MKQIFHCQKWLVRPPLDTLPQTIIFISYHKVARATGSKFVAKTIPECNSVKHRLNPKGKLLKDHIQSIPRRIPRNSQNPDPGLTRPRLNNVNIQPEFRTAASCKTAKRYVIS